jgi:hypothetical protein
MNPVLLERVINAGAKMSKNPDTPKQVLFAVKI